MNDLGNLLRELRGRKSLREIQKETGISHTYISTIEKGVDPRKSQKQVGEAIGVAESTVRMWELGKNNPSPHVLRKLADYYAVDYIHLMKIAGYLTDKDIQNFIGKER